MEVPYERVKWTLRRPSKKIMGIWMNHVYVASWRNKVCMEENINIMWASSNK
ncbi:hypothetical protein HanRHA438_Chr12g0556881 [Helianthus annuus]|nr:hypothetical protein HanIR_Chr12g0588311 [Helianthus annuus]KAJ0866888.1 hypothetical protein HanRHA438_Chr12g0556881 [Helianthus annuus]